MATKPGTPAASAATPPDGTIPEVTPTTTPTITFYKQLADEFMRELDEIAPIIPQLEAAHISTVNFVRSHLNVPIRFLATAIAAVEQTPALQAVNKLDVTSWPVATRSNSSRRFCRCSTRSRPSPTR